jgi:hypothetical protein
MAEFKCRHLLVGISLGPLLHRFTWCYVVMMVIVASDSVIRHMVQWAPGDDRDMIGNTLLIKVSGSCEAPV